ncbi:NifU family protein [Flavobacteriaceae bacterium F08102]|nr:NifU family protein [Flavobacteriaceae bacterium F08102]
MFVIKIETTTNPTVIKFVANKVLTEGSFEYNNIEEATNSSIIAQLFHLPFVKKVYVTANFIAIERYNIVEWPEVQSEIKGILEDYLNANDSLFTIKKKTSGMVDVYGESTPNPQVMKFVCSKLLTKELIEATSLEEAAEIPIAQALFKFEGVSEVFISENYLSITKTPEIEWFEITNELRDFLKSYLQENKPIVTENFKPKKNEIEQDDSPKRTDLSGTSQEIVSILDEYIKPAVTSDGGNILFQSYDENSKTVKVILQGACSGCPSSTVTLKNGIEATLKQLLPNKINEVVALNG